MRMKTLDDCPHVVLNSSKIVGTFVEHAYSPNGEHCAFTINLGNQNAHKIMIIDVRTGKFLGKCLRLFTCEKAAWSEDSQGFFIYVNINTFVQHHTISSSFRFNFKMNHSILQYDPEGKKKRHLYYHYLDEKKPDKLITKIRKVDANTLSFKVSHDYKFLILLGSRWLSIASIKSLEREIKFDLIFKFSQDIIYVSILKFTKDFELGPIGSTFILN